MSQQPEPYAAYPAVAGGSSTLSRYPGQFPANVGPFVRAQGCHLWDAQGQQWTDWTASLMPVLLGYGHPAVTAAVTAVLEAGGPSWPLTHPLAHDVARLLLRTLGLPAHQVRWFKSGTEANMAAVRVARAVTGRARVLKSGYQGWADWSIAHTPPAWGVPTPERLQVTLFHYNDLSGLTHALASGDPPAAVVLEPVPLDSPKAAFLPGVAGLCRRYGALLVFDETITLLRYPEGSAAAHYGVQPDLLVGGKGLANGFPLAALIGPPHIMACFTPGWRPAHATSAASGPVYCSGTFADDAVALAAAQACLTYWRDHRTAGYLHRAGQNLYHALQPALEQWGQERVTLRGHPYRWALEVRDNRGALDWPSRTLLVQELAAEFVLVGTGFNLMAAHTLAAVEQTQESWERALVTVAEAWSQNTVMERLRGPVIEPPYRQQ